MSRTTASAACRRRGTPDTVRSREFSGFTFANAWLRKHILADPLAELGSIVTRFPVQAPRITILARADLLEEKS